MYWQSKCQILLLNLPKQAMATAAFVRLPSNTLVSGLCG